MTTDSRHHRDPLRVPERVLRQRTSVKWTQYGPDVLPLWVAEMDCDLAPAVREAARALIEAGDTGYAGDGRTYVDAFAAAAEERWRWNVPSAVVVPNVMLGILGILRDRLPAGRPVIVSAPVYPPLMEYPRAAGYEVRPVGPGQRLDLGALAAEFSSLPPPARPGEPRGAYLLCTPHNPTGGVHSAEELRALGALAREHEVLLIADEIHALLSYAPFTPLLSVVPDAYALHSASKAFNLVGVNAALLVSGPQAPALRLAPDLRSAVSHVGVHAHSAALRHGGLWLDDLLGALRVRRTLVREFLSRELPEVGFREPEGTYLAWLDFSQVGGEALSTRFFVDECRVALPSGRPFGAPGHWRLNFATSESILLAALERIAGGLAGR